MADKSTDIVPTFVVATKALHADAPATVFRSYQCEDHDASECAIWKAARATSAAPTFFKPIQIERGVFVDGGLAHNNPGELALIEAQKIWKTVNRFCLVSVGTGRLATIRAVNPDFGSSESADHGPSKRSKRGILYSVAAATSKAMNAPKGSSTLMEMAKICMRLSTDSEHVHWRLQARYESQSAEQRFRYHRLNVERGMEDIGLQEYKKINEIAMHTAAYLDERAGLKNACVQDLMNPAALECKQTFHIN